MGPSQVVVRGFVRGRFPRPHPAPCTLFLPFSPFILVILTLHPCSFIKSAARISLTHYPSFFTSFSLSFTLPSTSPFLPFSLSSLHAISPFCCFFHPSPMSTLPTLGKCVGANCINTAWRHNLCNFQCFLKTSKTLSCLFWVDGVCKHSWQLSLIKEPNQALV